MTALVQIVDCSGCLWTRVGVVKNLTKCVSEEIDGIAVEGISGSLPLPDWRDE